MPLPFIVAMKSPAEFISNLAGHPTVRRAMPVVAFFAGFLWDALTIGQRVKPKHLWVLSAYLVAAGLIILWQARRAALGTVPPDPGPSVRERLAWLRGQTPNLALPFFFGGIFSAMFILYFKSSGHFGAFILAGALGSLLVANEFIGHQYGQRFTLTWALFALVAMLLLNFALPHAAGSLHPGWFFASTAAGPLLAHGLRALAPGRPGRIAPAWGVGLALLLAWSLDMIPPVPLVKRDVAVGMNFSQAGGHYSVIVEKAPWWAFWRDASSTLKIPEGTRLYGVSAVFAPKGVSAALAHRWEYHDPKLGWRQVYDIRFQVSGGREQGFRGYSYANNPAPGDWRLIVATQDGRTLAVENFRVERGVPDPDEQISRDL